MTAGPSRRDRIEELRTLPRDELAAAWHQAKPNAKLTLPPDAAGWDDDTLTNVMTDKLIAGIIAAEYGTGLRPSEITAVYWVSASAPGREGAAGFTGKWLVFVPAADVDGWWDIINAATLAGELGPRAKAATGRENTLQRDARRKVICVYTRDWRDKEDVRRVLARLRNLGIGWRLSYKTDAATAAGRYGDGAAIYVSPAGSLDFDDRTAGDDDAH